MKNAPRRRSLPVIGWREWVCLPELAIKSLEAKVDTGARTSVLHAVDVNEYRRAGTLYLRFKVFPHQQDDARPILARAPVIDRRHVRNSSGQQELRWVISTLLELNDERFPIELSLTSRHAMGFRMLLGRESVRRRFLVNPARSYLQGRAPRSSRDAVAREEE
ncbi:MAG: ATP-dependent zinc protease [Planctomycetota bacterium]